MKFILGILSEIGTTIYYLLLCYFVNFLTNVMLRLFILNKSNRINLLLTFKTLIVNKREYFYIFKYIFSGIIVKLK